ncbi:MAG TPA: zf-HC2 domain-containing protein [Candidatus Dormibacteraeota bacterium]|nr:zf-HC2 domain-containing protein [Candidatus Dormibacteraeota bacterium]
MPSESHTPIEPTLAELSAYLDHELDAGAQARVAEHVAGCNRCKARLDGLRQTAYAIRGLPMETPPRSFTVPQRSPRRSWAPVAGWVGSLAAATVLVVFGVTHLNFGAGPAATTANRSVSGGLAAAPAQPVQPYGAAAPLYQSETQASVAKAITPVNSKTAIDPTNSSRSLTIGTDAHAYAANGVLRLHVATAGLSTNEASTVRIFLVRDQGQGGYAIRLAPATSAPGYPLHYDAAYAIPQMPLPSPVAGNYVLQVEIQLSDGSALIAWLPLTITS